MSEVKLDVFLLGGGVCCFWLSRSGLMCYCCVLCVRIFNFCSSDFGVNLVIVLVCRWIRCLVFGESVKIGFLVVCSDRFIFSSFW